VTWRVSSSQITEGFFVIAAVIAATVLSATVMAGLSQVSGAYSQQAAMIKDRTDLQLEVELAYGNPGSTSVNLWVKNVGLLPLSSSAISKSDIFFGPTGAFQEINYGPSTPSWKFTLVNSGDNGVLNPGDTMQITITTSYPLTHGNYYFQLTDYLGTSFQDTFSV